VRTFFRFWYDFIVGDDWTIAAGVVLGLALVGLLAHNGVDWVWWLLPLWVAVVLTWSLLRVTRRG
jgi:hypothetical protein